MCTQHISNDNYPYLHKFLIGYCNQMAPDIYEGAAAAFDDFKKIEGDAQFEVLMEEVRQLLLIGKLPSIENLESAYNSPFWKEYGLILTVEDIEQSRVLQT